MEELLGLPPFTVPAICVLILIALYVFKNPLYKILAPMVAAKMPARINLVPSMLQGWGTNPQVSQLARELDMLGFVYGGTYAVYEMPEVTLWLMLHAGEGAYAVIYQHRHAGVWYDIYVPFADSTSVSLSNSRAHPNTIAHRPGHEKVQQKGTSPSVFFNQLRTEYRNRPRVAVSAEAFKPLFEHVYAEDMAWMRGERRPPTPPPAGHVPNP